MKKKAAAAALLMIFAGCAMKSDIVATYDGGSISRGEFFDWASSRGMKPESMKDLKQKQESRLKMMLTERFAAEEARKAGMDNDPAVKSLLLLSEGNLLSKIYIEEKIIPASSVAEPVRRVSHVFLRIAPNGELKDMKKNLEDMDSRAKEVLAALASGMPFEECAQKYSDDSTAQRRGDAGFISYEMVPEPYAKAAFSLKKGEYTKDAVRASGGLYIVKVTDIDAVNYENAEKVIDAAASAQRIRAGIYAKIMKLYIEKLSSEKDQSFNEAAAMQGKPTDIVITVGDKTVTAGQLKQFTDAATAVYTGSGAAAITPEKKLKYARDIYQMELVTRDARRAGFDRDASYLRKIGFSKDLVLSREFMRRISSFSGAIPEEKLRSEYEKTKQAKFAVAEQSGMDVKRKILPYAQVRENIRRLLVSSEEAKRADEWRNAVFASRHVVIKKEKLEGR